KPEDVREQYERQLKSSLVECPVCACRAIKRLPSAPRLNLSQSGAEAKPAAEQSEKASAQLQAMWLQMAPQPILVNWP
ncbi:MAG: DUF1178 family protein, partial [Burkholderiaceae bacterium]|nr:DUF1178 family protein [Burkholderiaceae bacterium]